MTPPDPAGLPPAPTEPTAPGRLPRLPTRAEREAMILAVDGIIGERIAAAGVPYPERADLMGDINLRLWELSETFDLDGPAKWSTFCHHASANLCLKWWSMNSRRVEAGAGRAELDEAFIPDPASLDDGDPDDDDLSEAAGAVVLAVRRQLAAPALNALTPGYKRLVEQVAFEGLAIDQIAAQAGQPVKSVMTNLGSAVGRLAAAGAVPAGMAERMGVDPAALAARTDPASTAARRARVAEELAIHPNISNRELARQVGGSEGAVARDRLRLRGDRPAKKGGRPKADPDPPRVRPFFKRPADRAAFVRAVRERVARMAAGGVGFDRIAASLGVTRGTAEQHWRQWKRRAAALPA